MATQMTPASVEGAIRALTEARRTNLGIEVTLPVAYGDGDLVAVTIEQIGDEFIVHDAGFSAMRLTGAGIPISRHVVRRLDGLAQRYRCTFDTGRVSSQATADNFAEVTCLVANACRSVADFAYEIKRQAERDFRAIVVDKLHEIAGDRLREAEDFRGSTGRHYRVPIILDIHHRGPEIFVATMANRQAVPQSFAMVYDLGITYPGIVRDAIYDDAADIRDEDKAFVSSLGADVFGLMEIEHHFREAVMKSTVNIHVKDH